MKKLLAGLLFCAVAFVIASPALAYPHLVSDPVLFRRHAINTTGTMSTDPKTVTGYSGTCAFVDSLASSHYGTSSGAATAVLVADTTAEFSLTKLYMFHPTITPAADSTVFLALQLVGVRDSIASIEFQKSVDGTAWTSMYTLGPHVATAGTGSFFVSSSCATWLGNFKVGAATVVRAIITPTSALKMGFRGQWVYPAGD